MRTRARASQRAQLLALGLLASGLLVLGSAGAARADVIWLENGGKIEGEIVREDASEIEVKGVHGTVVFKREDVKRVEKRLSPEKELEDRRGKLAADDVAGRVDLAMFAIEKRLPGTRALELALEAFELAPHDGTVIELLKKKLDARFEKNAWIPAERWYPEHGYVRHSGSWITLEQAAYLDAETATKQARTEEAAADKALGAAEKDVLASLEAESQARKEVERIKGILDSIDVKVNAARVDVDSKNADLARAQEQTAIALRDYTYLSTLPAPSDSKQADDLSRRINTAQSLLAVAQANESRARKARDAAQADLNELLALKAEGPRRLGAAQGVLEAALVRERAAKEIVPLRREATMLAKKRVEECKAAELTAKSVAAERRAQEARSESERDEALRAYKKDSGK